MSEVVGRHDLVVKLVVEEDVHVLAGGRDHHDRLVHVLQPAVHRDRPAPRAAAVVRGEQLDARIVLVHEGHVDGPAVARRVGVGGHADLGVELPPDGLAGRPADKGLRPVGRAAVGGAPKQDARAGAVALAGGGADAREELVDEVGTVGIDRHRRLPVALMLRVDVEAGRALVVERGGR